MAFDFLEKRRVGSTELDVPLLGMGCVQIGGWPQRMGAEAAQTTLEGAWQAGIRFFDTAPLYGFGTSECRLGAFLRTRDRDSYVLATKVGRLVVDAPDKPAVPNDEQFWKDAPAKECVFDFSYDGVMRSVEASLERLGVGRIDILHIHYPDDYADAALAGAYKALANCEPKAHLTVSGGHELRQYFDALRPRGRFQLLPAGRALHRAGPCQHRRSDAAVRGARRVDHHRRGLQLRRPYQADTRGHLRLYADGRDVARQGAGASRAESCRARDRTLLAGSRPAHQGGVRSPRVPLQAVALQFAAAHPAVASIVVGTVLADHIRQAAELLALEIPAGAVARPQG